MNELNELSALEKRIDYIISQLKAEQSIFLLSHWARYIAIISAGYFEEGVRLCVVGYCRKRANPQIVSFVEGRVAREGSINRAKLKKILDDFDLDLYDAIDAKADAETRSAVDSLKDLRDQLAHGKDNGTGLVTVLKYYAGAKRYIANMVAEMIR